MKLFLISPQDNCVQAVENLIVTGFGTNNCIKLKGRISTIWIVATDSYLTSVDVAKQLHMVGEAQNTNGGLVVEMNSYYGFDSGELWQKLSAWRKSIKIFFNLPTSKQTSLVDNGKKEKSPYNARFRRTTSYRRWR